METYGNILCISIKLIFLKHVRNMNPFLFLILSFSILQASQYNSLYEISQLDAIHKKVQELATGTASARDLNRDLSRFSNPTPIVDRLGREKFKDRDDGAASCQLLNLFVYINNLSPGL
jgi:hypothetical protein